MIENIHNNTQVLQQIEWDILEVKLAKHSYFDSTLSQLTRLCSKKELNYIFSQTELFLNQNHNETHFSAIQELRQLEKRNNFESFLSAIIKGKALRLSEINQIALSIEFLFNFYPHLTHLNIISLDKDALNTFKQSINKSFLKSFRKFVAANGDIEFEKHPKLRPLYLEQTEIEGKIRAFLAKSMSEGELASTLQFQSFDIINERYILPIRSDAYQSKFGQIVARSETGHTLFVEPHQIAKHNHKRLETLLKIDEIIAKIERELMESLTPLFPTIKTLFHTIKNFDEFSARASFADELGLSKPEISETAEIKIEGMFHPLISNPIRNDFLLDKDKQGFIISGPNTGGKTATLKTLALTQLFIHLGHFIPARSAKLYLYEHIYFFGNDGQDLESGLSSFSAEVTNYTKLLDQLTSSHLILIDEIFNSTSSEEASALALAIFDKLAAIENTHIVVSSHHQTLKTILHQGERFISAHVGFNAQTNSPTYKIEVGAPGSSFALNIFKSMTKDNDLFNGVYEKALSFLDNKAIHYEKLLEQIAARENELSKTLQKNKELQDELKNKKAAMDGIIKLKIEEKLKTAEVKIDKQIQKAKDLYFDIKSQKITKEKKIFDKDLELKAELKKISPFEEKYKPETHTNLTTPNEFVVGSRYFSILLNKTVTIKKLNLKKREALVSLGSLTIKSPLDKLKSANTKPNNSSSPSVPQGFIQRSVTTKLEYDCRGMRLEVFQDTVHQALSSLMIGDVPYLNIIHGHGNGVLKKWLREFVKNDKDITLDMDESGNDGSSRIILKKS